MLKFLDYPRVARLEEFPQGLYFKKVVFIVYYAIIYIKGNRRVAKPVLEMR
jgi:hypothetical protein